MPDDATFPPPDPMMEMLAHLASPFSAPGNCLLRDLADDLHLSTQGAVVDLIQMARLRRYRIVVKNGPQGRTVSVPISDWARLKRECTAYVARVG